MPNPVLKGQIYKQTAVDFGAALILPFEPVTLPGTIAGATISPSQSQALPCNVKVLALAIELENATVGTTVPALTLAMNVSSGIPVAGSIGVSQVTLIGVGVAGATGTATVTITGPTAATTQVVTVPITNAMTAVQLAAAIINAFNAANPSQVIANANGTNAVLTQSTPQTILAQLGGQQTVTYAQTGGAGLSMSPLGPTAFPPNPTGAQLGSPDNFSTSTPSSAFASQGQFVFAKFRSIAVTAGQMSPNFVQYSALMTAGLPGQATPPMSIAEYDIILPCTRGITLWLPEYTATGGVIAHCAALVMPVILDPNQPYPSAGMWVPNSTNLGAPSTA